MEHIIWMMIKLSFTIKAQGIFVSPPKMHGEQGIATVPIVLHYRLDSVQIYQPLLISGSIIFSYLYGEIDSNTFLRVQC